MDSSPVLVLLAGGKSSRMSIPKGLLDYSGTYWILEQIARFGKVDNPQIVIGLGYDHDKYFEAIPWLKLAADSFYNYNGVEVKVVINHQPQFGPFSTLQIVLKKINTHNTVLVQPIDVPLSNQQALMSIFAVNNTVVIPKCNKKNGHPVQLKPEFWNTLLTVDLTSSNARLDLQIKNYNTSSITYHKVTDKSVYQNINSLNEWNNYLINIDKS